MSFFFHPQPSPFYYPQHPQCYSTPSPCYGFTGYPQQYYDDGFHQPRPQPHPRRSHHPYYPNDASSDSSSNDEDEVEHRLVQLSDGSLALRPITKGNKHNHKHQQRQREQERRQREHEQREQAQKQASLRQKEQEELLRQLFGGCHKPSQQQQQPFSSVHPHKTSQPQPQPQPSSSTTTTKSAQSTPPSKQPTKPTPATTPTPTHHINVNITPVLPPPLPEKKNNKFGTTVSDEIEDETPVSDSDYNDDNDGNDVYDPYDINSPLIIDLPAPSQSAPSQTHQSQCQPREEVAVVQSASQSVHDGVGIAQPIQQTEVSPSAAAAAAAATTTTTTTTTKQPLPNDTHIDNTITKPTESTVSEHETSLDTHDDNHNDDNDDEQHSSQTHNDVTDANDALLTRLFEQTERLYTKRTTVLTKIKSLDPVQDNCLITTLRNNVKQIDALIEQTHKYTQELL